MKLNPVNLRPESPTRSLVVWICCLLPALVGSLLVFHPVWLASGRYLYGDHVSDAFGSVASLWQQNYARAHHWSVGHPALNGAPFEVIPESTGFHDPFNAFLVACTGWLGELATWNLCLLGSFLLSILTMSLLAREILTMGSPDDRRMLSSSGQETPLSACLAAGLAATIFVLCPYHLNQAKEHLQLATIQWLPLYLYVLIRFWHRRRIVDALGCALAFVLVFLSNYHLGYIMTIITGVFVMVWFFFAATAKQKDWRKAERTTVLVVLSILLSMAVLIPIVWPLMKANLPGAPTSEEKLVRPIEHLYLYAAYPIDYLFPPNFHPRFGGLPEALRGPLPSWVATERTVYLGWTVIILAGIGCLTAWKRRRENRTHLELMAFLAIGAVIAFLFSLPPTVTLLGKALPTPPLFMHHFLPMFRVSARFGVAVMLCVCCLACLGAYSIFSSQRFPVRQWILFALLTGLIWIEFADVPPYHYFNVTQPRPVYQWLAQQPDDFIVAIYPLYHFEAFEHYKYCFWQRVYHKRLFNGARFGRPGYATWLICHRLNDPRTVPILSRLGVKYVLVHHDEFMALSGQKALINPNKLLKSEGWIGTTEIFRVLPLQNILKVAVPG